TRVTPPSAAWAGLSLGGRTHVMGIVNVTPDSFSGDGLSAADAAADQAARMWADGAAVIDVGGESTRPGATPVDAAAELARVVPAIRAIRARLPDAPISIDSMKASVAAAALDAGATIVNDVTGFAFDDRMSSLCAERRTPVVLMHNAARADALDGESYAASDDGPGFLDRLTAALTQLRARAIAAGVTQERILLDPGIGFGKSPGQNLAIVKHVGALRAALGAPILIGASRKSFIGRIIGGAPDERSAGDAAISALAAAGGADLLRVHDAPLARAAAAIGRAVAGAEA
ncbi:MAG: dihydropteroate synthase, partial [Pseudomonadota bacterium]